MNLISKPEALSGLVILIVLIIIFISMVWRYAFKRWGTGKKTSKYLLSLKKRRDEEMMSLAIPMCIFETALELTVEELKSRDIPVFCFKSNEHSYVMKKSCSKPAIWFEYTSLCYVKGDFEGIVMRSFFNKSEFNRFIIEGNYFISHKKAQENKNFVNMFVECLKKNLTQIKNPLADEVEIINCNN